MIQTQHGLYTITPEDIRPRPDGTPEIKLGTQLAGASVISDGKLAQVTRTAGKDGSESVELTGIENTRLELATHQELAGPRGLPGKPDPSEKAELIATATKTKKHLKTPKNKPRKQPHDQDENLPPKPDPGMRKIMIAGKTAWTDTDGKAERTPLMPRLDDRKKNAEAIVEPMPERTIPLGAWMQLADSDGDIISEIRGSVSPRCDGTASVGSWSSTPSSPRGDIFLLPSGLLSFRWDFSRDLSDRLLLLDSSASWQNGFPRASYKFRIRFRRSVLKADGFLIWNSWSPWAEFDVNIPPSAPFGLRLSLS